MHERNLVIATNPVIEADFPDPDIIRVGDTYYMASTTMHFVPGCDILRSYDLLEWELLTHAYERLEESPAWRMEDGATIYGQGMWAPSLSFHAGRFYVVFTANDTQTTTLLTATDPAGPWERSEIQGFYHDNGLYFEDDRVFIVHGNTTLRLTELSPDLSGPLPGGLDRVVAQDKPNQPLGYEGSHLYRHDGRYYLFACHFPDEEPVRKQQVVFVADSLEGEFTPHTIIDDDMGHHGHGVAQGGMVDTPDGEWYLFMFQDRGAIGRAPVIIPMTWRDGVPAVTGDGRVPRVVSAPSTRPDHVYAPLYGDSFTETAPAGEAVLAPWWQFNHHPVDGSWSLTERPGAFRLRSTTVTASPALARGTLTQRTFGPRCYAEVTIVGAALESGDVAGLAAFQGAYGLVGLRRDEDGYAVVLLGRGREYPTIEPDPGHLDPPAEHVRIAWPRDSVRVRVVTDFRDMRDIATFWVESDTEADAGPTGAGAGSSTTRWRQIGGEHPLYFALDHFVGCRFALCLTATQRLGGTADFLDFRLRVDEDDVTTMTPHLGAGSPDPREKTMETP